MEGQQPSRLESSNELKVKSSTAPVTRLVLPDMDIRNNGVGLNRL